MKTGILTYHNTRNCGALLQTYALQKKLFELGNDNEIIDYRCDKIEEAYRLKKIYEIKDPKQLVKWFLTIRRDTRAQRKFSSFKDKYLKLSAPYDKNTIHMSNHEFDSFITGSDQVWNPALNGNDCTYLLNFAEDSRKKISYAASMGGNGLDKQYAETLRKELGRFDFISVREKPLAGHIENMLGVMPPVVLDPTLLLDEADYSFVVPRKLPKKKYIFVYTIAPTPNIESAAKSIAKETGFEIIWGHMSYRKKSGVKNITDLSPDEFFYYIKNAEYVFTSSFHGMAMSIVLQKQFFYDLDKSVQNNNSRLETLAECLGLQNRELFSGCDPNKLVNEETIDYKKVYETLEKNRRESIDFLKKCLETCSGK